MSFSTTTVASSATVLAVDTRSIPKVVFLPTVSTNAGRVLVFKDYYGTASNSTITLSTTGTDLIDDFNWTARLTSSFATMSLLSDGVRSWRPLGLYTGALTPPGPFLPTQITGLQLWLDATDVNGNGTSVANGASISTWTDKSGNGRNGTANTSITYATSGLGTGYPALTFTGSQWVNGSVSISGTTMTVFNVFSMNSSSPFAARVLALARTETNDFDNVAYVGILRQSSTNIGPYRNGTYTQATTPYATRLMNTTYFDGTNQYTATNGGTSSSSASSGSFAVTAYRVANNTNSGDTAAGALNGFVGEVLVYNSSLITAQRQQVEGYLAWKWGLQGDLPANHPYKNAPP